MAKEIPSILTNQIKQGLINLQDNPFKFRKEMIPLTSVQNHAIRINLMIYCLLRKSAPRITDPFCPDGIQMQRVKHGLTLTHLNF